MKKFVAIMLVCVFCFGVSACCSAKAKYDAGLNSRVGAHIDTVVAERGEPTNTLVGAEGYTIYQWYKQETYSKLGMGEVNWCQTSFTVDGAGIIQSASSRGNNCSGEADRSFFVNF